MFAKPRALLRCLLHRQRASILSAHLPDVLVLTKHTRANWHTLWSHVHAQCFCSPFYILCISSLVVFSPRQLEANYEQLLLASEQTSTAVNCTETEGAGERHRGRMKGSFMSPASGFGNKVYRCAMERERQDRFYS